MEKRGKLSIDSCGIQKHAEKPLFSDSESDDAGTDAAQYTGISLEE